MITQKGFTLVEIMIAMAISLAIAGITATIYINSSTNQRALIKQDESIESASYAMTLIGREIMKAGFYPSQALNDTGTTTQLGMYETYPPLPNDPRAITDWQDPSKNWPPKAYQTGVYGCTDGTFNISNATCPTPNASEADTLVINYFSNDALGPISTRRDCTGADVGNDPSNATRKTNSSGNTELPPAFPLFISNRFTLSSVNIFIDDSTIATKSLTCSGNGSNKHGDNSKYQPIVSGLIDMGFSYSIYTDEKEFLASKFYSASEIENLATSEINGQLLNGWQRVIAIKACIISETLGSGARLSDATGTIKTYNDCSGTEKNIPAGKKITKNEKIFGVKNKLNQSY